MGGHKLNDDEFQKLKSAIIEQAQPHELFRQWSGCKKTIEKLKTEQASLLSRGDINGAQELTRAILQAEQMAGVIEKTAKFQDFKKRLYNSPEENSGR